MKRILMLTGLCALLYQKSCTSRGEEIKEDNTKFLVTHPVMMDTAITEQYVCQIHAIRHIELRAQERGYLQKIYVDEGDFVKEGQLLFQIMPRLYEAELQKAQAEANFAQIEYDNTKALADSNIVAPNELAMAKSKVDKAKAELALAQTHLGFTQIRAPFDGIIDRFHVRPGSLLEEGELLSNLSDNSQLWVYYNVPEAEYLDYQAEVTSGEAIDVRLFMANNKMFEYPGVVETIEADFNHETGNIAFRATFPNPKGLLRHGETGNIQMAVPLENALLIPQKATFEVLEKKYVFVITDDHVVTTREITVGEELPHLYVVTEGLDEKDQILLEGLRLVRENEKIATEYQAPESVIAHLDLYAE